VSSTAPRADPTVATAGGPCSRAARSRPCERPDDPARDERNGRTHEADSMEPDPLEDDGQAHGSSRVKERPRDRRPKRGIILDLHAEGSRPARGDELTCRGPADTQAARIHRGQGDRARNRRSGMTVKRRADGVRPPDSGAVKPAPQDIMQLTRRLSMSAHTHAPHGRGFGSSDPGGRLRARDDRVVITPHTTADPVMAGLTLASLRQSGVAWARRTVSPRCAGLRAL